MPTEVAADLERPESAIIYNSPNIDIYISTITTGLSKGQCEKPRGRDRMPLMKHGALLRQAPKTIALEMNDLVKLPNNIYWKWRAEARGRGEGVHAGADAGDCAIGGVRNGRDEGDERHGEEEAHLVAR